MLVRIDKQDDQAKCLYRTVSVRIDRQKGQAKGVETAGDQEKIQVRSVTFIIMFSVRHFYNLQNMYFKVYGIKHVNGIITSQ